MKNFLCWVFNSSEDPEKISALVTGFLITWSSYIVDGINLFHKSVTMSQVTDAASQLGIVVGAIWAFVGGIRKIINIFRK